jgi:hypothetical protein
MNSLQFDRVFVDTVLGTFPAAMQAATWTSATAPAMEPLAIRWMRVVLSASPINLADVQWLHAHGCLQTRAFMRRHVLVDATTRGHPRVVVPRRHDLPRLYAANPWIHTLPKHEQGQFAVTVAAAERWFTDSPVTEFLWECGYYDATGCDPAMHVLTNRFLCAYATSEVRGWIRRHPFPGSAALLRPAKDIDFTTDNNTMY